MKYSAIGVGPRPTLELDAVFHVQVCGGGGSGASQSSAHAPASFHIYTWPTSQQINTAQSFRWKDWSGRTLSHWAMRVAGGQGRSLCRFWRRVSRWTRTYGSGGIRHIQHISARGWMVSTMSRGEGRVTGTKSCGNQNVIERLDSKIQIKHFKEPLKAVCQGNLKNVSYIWLPFPFHQKHKQFFVFVEIVWTKLNWGIKMNMTVLASRHFILLFVYYRLFLE